MVRADGWFWRMANVFVAGPKFLKQKFWNRANFAQMSERVFFSNQGKIVKGKKSRRGFWGARVGVRDFLGARVGQNAQIWGARVVLKAFLFDKCQNECIFRHFRQK